MLNCKTKAMKLLEENNNIFKDVGIRKTFWKKTTRNRQQKVKIDKLY